MSKQTISPEDVVRKFIESEHSDWLREMVSMVVHMLMEGEIRTQTNAEHGERNPERKNHRNGYREREWKTRLGEIALKIPKLRKGSYLPGFIEPRRRAEKALICAVSEAYIQGVTTRRMEKVCEQLGVMNMDKSFVSRITAVLDQEVNEFKNRRLEGEYPYVYADARYEKVRRGGRVRNTATLVAVGVRSDGHREVLGFAVNSEESHTVWLEFFQSLIDRGLSGVQLVISDAHAGLKSAIHALFVGATWQRCRVHFQRSVLSYVYRQHRPMVSAMIKTIFVQTEISQAREKLHDVARALEKQFPKVTELLEEAEDDLLAYMHFPIQHWAKLYSTNMLERLMKTLKARTRVAGIFPSEQSLIKLVGAILIEENEEWFDAKRYISETSMAALKNLSPTPRGGEGEVERALLIPAA